jgi:hypothetical protein
MSLKAISTKSKLIPKRAKELNIIYFLDSNRTNSFKISFGQLRWIVLGLVVASLWALFSVGFVAYQYSRNSEIEVRLESAIARLFEYQTRFENVYEKAYPTDLPSNSVESGEQVASQTIERGTGKQLSRPSNATATALTTANTPSQANMASNTANPGTNQGADRIEMSAKTSNLIASESSSSVKIENLMLQFEQGGLAARFSLRNTDSSTKAEGVLLGVAKFEAVDGTVSYIGSPLGVRPDSKGIAQSPHEGFRFGIKFHKPKKLSFALPAGQQGRFTEVKLFVSGTKRGDFDASFMVDEKVQRQFLAHTQTATKPTLSSGANAAPESLVPKAGTPESASADPALSDEDLTPSEDGGE